jgi:F0F1-type ATP synthase membrane subunit b/b'
MARKQTPKELRAQANELLEKARMEEDKRYNKIGRMAVMELLNNKCKQVADLKTMKEQVRAIWEG